MPSVHDKERQLQRDVAHRVETGLPGVEVLALELLSPTRFCVYVDHPGGVDHALCERVTRLLDSYNREYSIDVSSPGLERPLRTPAHFRGVVGQTVALRISTDIGGHRRFRGAVVGADERTLKLDVGSDAEPVNIPYDTIVRGNLIDEGS